VRHPAPLGGKEVSMNKVVSKDVTEIAYEKTGHGFPLILVGGALSDRSAAVPLATLLAPHFLVLAYDRRGRGDSGDTAPYAVQREVEDIQAIIAEAGGSAFVFGHSSGSVLALEAAARGLAISKLAMYEPPFMINKSSPPLPKDYGEHLRELLTSGRRGDAVEYFMTTAVGVPREAVAQMRQSPTWTKLENVAHTIVYDQTIMENSTTGTSLPAARWSTATMPVLVFNGGASPARMRNAVQALVEILPSAKRLSLEGQTHRIDPAILAPVLIEFFDGLR
jgi:pimeloyl-ACP methyl ester carboxylesterase